MPPAMQYVGVSVTGPSHVAVGDGCQDAHGGEGLRYGGWAAAADGVGSCPSSAAGSAAAVRACRFAWLHWRRARKADGRAFVRLVEALWHTELDDTPPGDACTTVIFAGVAPDGRALVAQLGDGLLFLRRDGQVKRFTPPRDGFGNETEALGASRRTWNVDVFQVTSPDIGFLLATDGVSDDLSQGNDTELFDWSEGAFVKATDGQARLKAALEAWPVPNHSDDKTMVLLCART